MSDLRFEGTASRDVSPARRGFHLDKANAKFMSVCSDCDCPLCASSIWRTAPFFSALVPQMTTSQPAAASSLVT